MRRSATMTLLFLSNIPPPSAPPLHTCQEFRVNKGALSCHCVALGQVYFTAFCFLVFRVVSGCQTRYSSRRPLKVGTLIACDSVSLSFKKQLHGEVAADIVCAPLQPFRRNMSFTGKESS